MISCVRSSCSQGGGLLVPLGGGESNFRQFVHDEYKISKKLHTVTVLTVTDGSSSARVWESATCSAPEKRVKPPVEKRPRKNGETEIVPILAALKTHSECVYGGMKIQDIGEKLDSQIRAISPAILHQ
jgi:hypothetical protein